MTKQKSQITFIREAVRLLDAKLGRRWPFDIKLRALDMRYEHKCVLGQLFGDYFTGLWALKLYDENSVKTRTGFDVSISLELWKTKIRQLRESRTKHRR